MVSLMKNLGKESWKRILAIGWESLCNFLFVVLCFANGSDRHVVGRQDLCERFAEGSVSGELSHEVDLIRS